MNEQKKILVTGLGIISCIGSNVEIFWDSCIQGKSGIKKIQQFDPLNLNTKIAGTINFFNPKNYMSSKHSKRYGLSSQYAIAAALEALEDAHLLQEDKKKMGCVIGTGLGGFDVIERNLFPNSKNEFNINNLSPFFIPYSIPNVIAGELAIHYQIGGPNFTVNSACASSNHAISQAYLLLKSGYVDIILTGGSEASISPLVLKGFSIINALSKNNEHPEKASRPFDLKRDGFVLSEGAAMLILETEASALKRGVQKIYGEIIGVSMTADHYHITLPHPEGEGIINCFNQLFYMNNISPEKINYINAHATGTKIGDFTEQYAIKKFFGESFAKKNIKINSTKSIIGHSLGASGAMEAIAVLKSIEKKKLHPTINYENFDPECDLVYTTKAIDFDIQVALSNSFGFGGQNSIIAFQSYY